MEKILYMCQEHAANMHSVKETARKIRCPTESDEMNMKRITRHLKSVPSAKCLTEFTTLPQSVNVYTDSDWAGQPVTCNSTCGERNFFCMVTNTTVSELEFSRRRPVCPVTTGITEGMVTNLKELGYEVTLVNHVDYQHAEGMASKRGLRLMKRAILKYLFVPDVVEKKQTTLPYVNTKSSKPDLMTLCHTCEAHMKKVRNAGSETLQRRRKKHA